MKMMMIKQFCRYGILLVMILNVINIPICILLFIIEPSVLNFAGVVATAWFCLFFYSRYKKL
jgi:hypothetical protein